MGAVNGEHKLWQAHKTQGVARMVANGRELQLVCLSLRHSSLEPEFSWGLSLFNSLRFSLFHRTVTVEP